MANNEKHIYNDILYCNFDVRQYADPTKHLTIAFDNVYLPFLHVLFSTWIHFHEYMKSAYLRT